MINYQIKITFDFDENQYLVFINGINGIDGRGDTEQEAIDNFKNNFQKMSADNTKYSF